MGRHPERSSQDDSPLPGCTQEGRLSIMWYVSILSSKKDGRLYVGSTDDLKRRLEEHRQGRCESTRPRRILVTQSALAESP